MGINILLVAYILYDPLTSAYDYLTTTNARTTKNKLYGAWKVEKIEKWQNGNWSALMPSDSGNFNRFFFEGYTGVLQSPLKRQRFSYFIDSTEKQVTLNFINNQNTRYESQIWQLEKPTPDKLLLIGRWSKDSLRAECIPYVKINF